MSEKIKGMYGSETRADEVREWLKSQGAEEHTFKGNFKDVIYFVYQGEARRTTKDYSMLFDIVELPRWRAEKGGEYYFVDFTGEVGFDVDVRETTDNATYEIGNYFQTKEEAEPYAEKFREILKRKEA